MLFHFYINLSMAMLTSASFCYNYEFTIERRMQYTSAPINYLLFDPDSKCLLVTACNGRVSALELTNYSVLYDKQITTGAFANPFIVKEGDQYIILESKSLSTFTIKDINNSKNENSNSGSIFPSLFEMRCKRYSEMFGVWGLRSAAYSKNSRITLFGFAPKGPYRLTGNVPDKIRAFNLTTELTVNRDVLEYINNSVISNVISSPYNDNFFVSGTTKRQEAGYVMALSCNKGVIQMKGECTTFSEPVRAIAVSPDKRHLAVGTSCTVPRNARSKPNIYIMDIITNKIKCDDIAFVCGVTSVVYSPDGKLLALAGDDSTIYVLSSISLKVVAKLAGHQSNVTSIQFSGDGIHLASGSRDGEVLVWKYVSGR